MCLSVCLSADRLSLFLHLFTTYLDHDESSFAECGTLHGVCVGCPGIGGCEIEIITHFVVLSFLRVEKSEKDEKKTKL